MQGMEHTHEVLENGRLRATVLPSCGGALLNLTLLGRAAHPVELLRAAPPAQGRVAPEDSACFPLVPWSNRLSQGGFSTPTGRIRIEPNRPPEPYPIHGEGWLLPWRVMERAGPRIVLGLDRSQGGPYLYRARLSYTLVGITLRMELSVTHLDEAPMPYGLGLHPWLPFEEGMQVRAAASGMWQETGEHLPGAYGPVPSDVDFATFRAVPDRWTNNAFDGWDGRADFVWPRRQVSLALRCRGAPYFVLYHPPGETFICFEPVTHPVDAFHLPPPRRGEGLRWLRHGETLSLTCELAAADAGPTRA